MQQQNPPVLNLDAEGELENGNGFLRKGPVSLQLTERSTSRDLFSEIKTKLPITPRGALLRESPRVFCEGFVVDDDFALLSDKFDIRKPLKFTVRVALTPTLCESQHQMQSQLSGLLQNQESQMECLHYQQKHVREHTKELQHPTIR